MIINMTSMLFLTTNLEKQPQKIIHFEVDIILLWQTSITKLSNLLRRFIIDWASMTLGMVLVCNKKGVFQFKRMDMGKHFAVKRFYWVLKPK